MRRTWVKLYVDQTLRGTTSKELEPAERWIWIGFLLLAGDSPGELEHLDGKVCLSDGVGFTDRQLAEILKVPVRILKSAKEKCVRFGKIVVSPSNVIEIVNWKRYQSEYQRQKPYRRNHPPHTPPEEDKKEDLEVEGRARSNPTLQSIVTSQSYSFEKLPYEAQRRIFSLRERKKELENRIQKARDHPSKTFISSNGSVQKIEIIEAQIREIDEEIESVFESCK